MKNKLLLGISVLILMIGSFFGGSYVEKQKIKNSPYPPTPQISPIPQKIIVVEVSDGDTLKLSDGKHFGFMGLMLPKLKNHILRRQKLLLKI